jgi:hypothetical protein
VKAFVNNYGSCINKTHIFLAKHSLGVMILKKVTQLECIFLTWQEAIHSSEQYITIGATLMSKPNDTKCTG